MKKIPMGTCSAKAKIGYPCQWTYTVIGTEPASLRAAVQECAGSREYCLNESKSSSGGKYKSLKLQLQVQSEAERLLLHGRLAAHSAIRVVI